MGETHYHHHYEILYIKENSRILRIGANDYELNKNNVAIIPPFIPHMTLSGEIPQKRYLINFRAELIHNIENMLGLNLINCFNPVSPIIPIKEFFNKFCNILDALTNDYENISSPYRNALLSIHLSELLILFQNSATPIEANYSIESIIQYIERNFNTPITLDILEKKFLTNKYTISRKFNALTGLSIPKYVSILRIIHAKKLLEKDMSLIDISESCGFNSLNDFERVFKSETGCSPLKFRKEISNKPYEP